MGVLNDLLEKFTKKYVQCFECENPETRIRIKKGDIYLKCKVPRCHACLTLATFRRRKVLLKAACLAHSLSRFCRRCESGLQICVHAHKCGGADALSCRLSITAL